MKITLVEWRIGHLAAIAPCDLYYVKIANKLLDHICFNGIDAQLMDYDYHKMAVSLAYYFEDVISNIGFWRTFVTTHKEFYNKYLPFYEVDEEKYYTDEINLADVRLLLWMGAQRSKENVVFNPEDARLEKLATELYGILDEEFENAPINTVFPQVLFEETYFSKSSSLQAWVGLLYDNIYLFQDEKEWNHKDEEAAYLEEMFGSKSLMATYTARAILSFSSKVGPLALTIPQWMNRLLKLKGMEREAELLNDRECIPLSIYLLKGYDNNSFTLMNFEGETFTVLRRISELPDESLKSKKTLATALLRDKDGMWDICGIPSWSTVDKVFFSEQDRQRTIHEHENTMSHKMAEINQNYPLFFFASHQEMGQWMITHFNLPDESGKSASSMEAMPVTLFIRSGGKLSAVYRKSACIKDDRNPYYNQQKAQAEAASLIFDSDSISSEMIHYLVEHDMLSDARINSASTPARGRQLLQENLDFLLRFNRRYEY